jgi:tRNA threonylcarbamoyladenosine biosynthesis protein TsaE
MPAAPVAPVSPISERQFSLPDEAATLAFGERFAAALRAIRESESDAGADQGVTTGVAHAPSHSPSTTTSLSPAPSSRHRAAGLHVHLLGDLGAGKTTLVRATLHALGHRGRVRSPTYTLVEPYNIQDAGRPNHVYDVYHFDLYRFADPREWVEAGFREYFNEGALCLVEWPQKAGTLIGVPDLSLTLDLAGDGRVLTARAYSARGKECLDRC